MKKLCLLLLVAFNFFSFGANVYFDTPPNGYTYYSGPGGYAVIPYHILTVSLYFVTDWYGAKLQYPDGSWSVWQNGQSGGWTVTKAGTYHLQGAVHVVYDLGGESNYHMYSSTITVYVVDNYSPSIPQNFQVSSPLNQNPVLSWYANAELDLSGYRVYKKYTTSSGSTTISIFTTSTTYTDGDFTANYHSGEDVAEYWVTAEDINNNVSGQTTHKIVDGTSGIQWKLSANSSEKPTEFDLDQNYPNPFNPTTLIRYDIKEKGFVSLVVYDISGREVATLVDDYKDEGSYLINFEATNLPSGVYIYRLKVNNYISVKKMTYLK